MAEYTKAEYATETEERSKVDEEFEAMDKECAGLEAVVNRLSQRLEPVRLQAEKLGEDPSKDEESLDCAPLIRRLRGLREAFSANRKHLDLLLEELQI